MGDIFISYKAEDRARVRPLVAALEAAGLTVWWDVHIEGGVSWRQTIQERLDAAGCVLVVWSRASAGPTGHFVHDEASCAQRRGTYLPVRIDPVTPPIGFGETQALDLVRWRSGAADPRFVAVIATIRAMLAGEAPRGSRDHIPISPGLDRRALLAGGGSALALAGGGFALWRHMSRPPSANAIAVLPFQNLSGDVGQAYFSEGMSEELRDSLARIAGLKVAARVSSDQFRDARDAGRIADRLHVA